jgi:hypothetical protein
VEVEGPPAEIHLEIPQGLRGTRAVTEATAAAIIAITGGETVTIVGVDTAGVETGKGDIVEVIRVLSAMITGANTAREDSARDPIHPLVITGATAMTVRKDTSVQKALINPAREAPGWKLPAVQWKKPLKRLAGVSTLTRTTSRPK